MSSLFHVNATIHYIGMSYGAVCCSNLHYCFTCTSWFGLLLHLGLLCNIVAFQLNHAAVMLNNQSTDLIVCQFDINRHTDYNLFSLLMPLCELMLSLPEPIVSFNADTTVMNIVLDDIALQIKTLYGSNIIKYTAMDESKKERDKLTCHCG